MKYFLFSCLFLISCVNSEKILPNSTGEDSELIFVVDDSLWVNSIFYISKSVFGEEIIGINQIEPAFKIIQVNHGEFKSILKTHKNIIIISSGGAKSSQKNKWSFGQFVAQINWDGDIRKLQEEFIELRSVFIEKEFKSIRSSVLNSSQKKNEAILLRNFGVKCLIPYDFYVINNDSNFFWANYNSSKSDVIKNILVFSFLPKTKNFEQEILLKIDSVFKKHLIGQKEGSYARIEPQFSPHYFKNTFRGLWRLEKGFMGGPFIAKTYFIKNKIVVNVGMAFAPQSTKRKYIKEFEAIL